MSDVMPYKSSLFKELKGKRLTAYKSAFTHVLQSAVNRFNPDIIHTNHLFLLSALGKKAFSQPARRGNLPWHRSETIL